MRKKILKKNFFLKKIELLFSDSLQAVDDFDVHIFSRELLEHRQNDKSFLVGENFFLKKFYLGICMILTSFLPFILSNCMFWTLLTVIIFGLSSRNIRKMRKNMRKTKVAKEFFWTFLLSFPLNLHVFHMFILNKFLIRPLRGFENNKRTLWQKTFYSQKE